MSGFVGEWRSDFRSPKVYVIWAVLTVIIGFAGPFGTYEPLSLPMRLLLWSLLVSSSIIIGFTIRAFVQGTLNMRGFLDGTVLTAGLNAVVLPPVIVMTMISVDDQLPRPNYDELAVFAFLVTLGAGAYRWAAQYKQSRLSGQSPLLKAPPEPKVQMPPSHVDELSPPRLMLRLPETLRGSLIAISVRDHYVDVATDKGSASLLMRLSDAVDETMPTDGARVHRSHWVAWDAVEGVEKSGERLQLRMRNGAIVPVSKTYRALVEARGIGIARAECPTQRIASAAGPIRDERAESSHQSPPV